MGNDIVSVLIDRKKKTTIRFSLLFVKYLMGDKAKLNKTIEKIISIYYQDFYLQENIEEEDLKKYFDVDTFKDSLLKIALLCTVRFYKENGIEEKIKKDIRTVIYLANAVYLALSLSIIVDRNYEKEASFILDNFLHKYQTRIRVAEENKKEFEKELLALIKKEATTYNKFFKSLDDSQYKIELEPLLDYRNGYLVKGNYEIKMLSRYSLKEVEQVYFKKEFYLQHFLITLERISSHYLKEILKGREIPKYFLPIPIELIENEKYMFTLLMITKNIGFKSSLVFVLSYRELSRHLKQVKELVQNGFAFGVKNLEGIELKKNSFDYVNYVFTTPKFIEKHSTNYELWENKDVRFIIWEGELS